jgi:hypothetical protein
MPSLLSASYTMDGTERMVSSGIILDVNGFVPQEELFLEESRGTALQEEFGTEDEQILRAGESKQFPPSQFPFLGSFTVAFNEPGTYDYFCAFHPGMFGQVVVGCSSEEGQTNQS